MASKSLLEIVEEHSAKAGYELDGFLKGKMGQIESEMRSGRLDATQAMGAIRTHLKYNLKDYHYNDIEKDIKYYRLG